MRSPIRALYLQPAAHFGGAERQAATIVPLLPQYEVETIPVVGPGAEITAWLRDRGVTNFIHSGHFPGGWPKLRGTAKLSLPLRYARCLRSFRSELSDLCRAHDIDIIIAAMAFSWVAATPVARALEIPIIWRAGGTECARHTRALLGAWARAHPPDWLVCNGDAVQRMFAPVVGSPSTVIRNGLDDRQFFPKAERRQDRELVIGFAARLVPQKRPEDFIALAARYASHPGVRFVIVGDGSRREEYSKLAERSGARTLEVTGFVRDMQSFYAACDVLVLPSRSEGCPNVVLEAMAMGTVVVAADAAGTREIVTDGVDGLLYPVGDVDALDARIRLLLSDPARRERLIEGGYRRARQLNATACAARTAALMHAIVRSQSRGLHRLRARCMELRA